MIAHLTYLGFYHASKTDVIPLKDQHVYKITRLEGGYKIPVGWDTGVVYARVGEAVTEDNLSWAMNENVSMDVT